MRSISEIIIHCSATPEGKPFTAQDIDRWHRQRGYNGIGYHFVILLDGSIQRGRPIDQVGAHCLGHNAQSIGICYIGGLSADGSTPLDTRTPAQRTALVALVQELKMQYPQAALHGHNELTCKQKQNHTETNSALCNHLCTQCKFSAKACPSFNVQSDPELCNL